MADIKAIKSRYEEDANDLLARAMEENFETVLIIGFKNGKCLTAYSEHTSRAKIVGALEEFKFRLLSDIYGR